MPVAVSTLLPTLRLELPGIAEPVLEDALFRGLRKYFWESEAWKYTADNGLDYTAAQQALNLPVAGTDIPTKTAVKRVDTVKFSASGANWDKDIPFKTRDQLDRADADWYTATGTDPKAFTYDNAQAIIYPIASATVNTALLLRCIIVPLYTAVADTLPDLLYYENEEYIKAGIWADLMKQPGKDWTNSALAAHYSTVYKRGVDKGKSRAEADFGQPNRTMSYGGI